jgi:dTDP-4-dehydrorhamnose reductase
MRILLTGVNGQVGSALRGPLASLGSVLAADRTAFDLSRPNELPAILDAMAPELIVNPAAYTAVDQAEDEKELAYCVNAEAPLAIARWAARHDVPMVHISTDYVFDGSGDRPWREDDPTAPLSVYGASKLDGELAVRNAGGHHLVVRTSWVFASKGNNFLNTIVRLARERSELRIVTDQVGAPTSARVLADGLISILGVIARDDRDWIARRFDALDGLVHMSTSGETSWHGFACAIVEGLRNRGAKLAVGSVIAIPARKFPTKAVRPLNSRLDMDRLEKVLGVRMPSWRDALDQELDELSRSDQWLRGGDRNEVRPT